jgi:WD40 repeat protein
MAARPEAGGRHNTGRVSATLRSLVRRLTGPTGRRALALLLVAGLWAYWYWTPPRPREEWTAPNVSLVTWFPDGRTLAVAGSRSERSGQNLVTTVNRGPVRVFDVASGRVLDRLFDGENAFISRLVTSPDGTRLLAADASGAAVVWDRMAERVTARLSGVYGAAVFSPDGGRVVAGADHRCQTLALWPDFERPTPIPLPDAVFPAEFSPDGRELTMADESGPGIRLWDSSTGRELHGTYWLSSLGRAWTLAYDPHRRRLAALTAAGVELFDTKAHSRTAVLSTPQLRLGSPATLEFSPEGRILVARSSGYAPSHVAVWDLSATPPEELTGRLAETSHQLPLYAEPGVPYHRYPVFTPDGTGVLADTGCGQLRLLDTDTLIPRVSFALQQVALDCTSPVFSLDGRLLATTVIYETRCLPSDNQTWWDLARTWALPIEQRWATQVFDVATGRRLAALPGHKDERPFSIHFAPEGMLRVASLTPGAAPSLVIRMWDVPTSLAPVWLLGATIGGLALVVADWRRSIARH